MQTLRLPGAAFNASREEKVARAVDQFLLDRQFMSIDDLMPEMENVVWEVFEGAGRGLIHATDFCDLAWYRGVEAWGTDPDIMLAHDICKLARFRDDIIIQPSLAAGHPRYWQTLQAWRRGRQASGGSSMLKKSKNAPFVGAEVALGKRRSTISPYAKPSAMFNVP